MVASLKPGSPAWQPRWGGSAHRPLILVDRIPRPEGAQYSVARFAGSVIPRNETPGLRSLRSLTRGYPLPPLRGSQLNFFPSARMLIGAAAEGRRQAAWE